MNESMQDNVYHLDLMLAQKAAGGDTAAGTRMMERLLTHVLRTVSYLTGYGSDAEDLAQQAFIQILRSAGSFRGQTRLEYWADRIALRVVLKYWEKKKRRSRINEATWNPPVDRIPADSEADAGRIRRRLGELLMELSPGRRAVVVLHHVQGYNLKEISIMTDSPLETVRDRLKKGRKLLRKYILADPVLKEWIEAGGLR